MAGGSCSTRHDPDEAVRVAVWQGLEAIDERAAGRLHRRDEARPLLVIGSLAFWAVLALVGLQGLLPTGWPVWALAGTLWLVALVILGWLAPGLNAIPQRLLGGLLGLASTWLLVATWGWLRGIVVLPVLILALWDKAYLLLAAALGYLAFLAFVAPTAGGFLTVTGASIFGLPVLTLAVPRWRGSSLDRGAAVAIVGAGLGAVISQLLVGSPVDAPGGLLLLACGLALIRWLARRPLSYSGGSASLVASLADLVRAIWDAFDQISFNLKPLLGGIAGAAWAAVLIGAAAALSPGSQPAWTVGDALLLSAGLGLGLWLGQGGLVRAVLLPALGGALGGALAQGLPGAVAGACIGVGLGLGEYLGNRLLSARNEPAEPATQA